MIVATIRALKMHGGVAKDDLKVENVAALEKGFANLKRHIANVQKFGVPVIVSVNRFSTDTAGGASICMKTLCEAEGVDSRARRSLGARAAPGAEELAHEVIATIEAKPAQFKPLYADDMPLVEKVRTIAREIYGAADISPSLRETRFAELEKGGLRPSAGLHRQDPIQLLDRRERQGRARGLT